MRYYSNVAGQTTVTAGVTGADTAIPLASVTGLPASYPFTLAVDVGAAGEEVVTVTNLIGLLATVIRGEDGTAATGHAAGAVVRHVLSARDLREPQDHIAATSGVHGVGSGASVAGTSTAQTLTNKTVSGLFNTISDIPKAAVPADTVYTADAQTLTNKTVSGATNTLTGIPDASILDLAASKLTGVVAKANLPADVVYTATTPAAAVDVFTLSGTWTKPAGARTVRVRCVGAGGGGGLGLGSASGQGQGGGAGSGGYVEKLYAASTLPATVAVTVGAGGLGNTNPGGWGGASVFDVAYAGGGGGGNSMTATTGTSTASGGGGGNASGGDLNVVGDPGGHGRVLAGASTLTGYGGGSVLGARVESLLSSAVPGPDGNNYGGGGGGAFVATVSRNGGTGAPGVVIVETWF